MPATTPDPPYLAVIFTSVRTPGDNGYGEAADRMFALASESPGFLGMETARSEEGITVCYWTDHEAMAAWRNDPEHLEVQARADEWYEQFEVRIARVERAYPGGGR